MTSLEAFDREVLDVVTSNKLSSSRVKSITEAAMANIDNDAHLVATLFKVHKQAKGSHKLSSLYIIDAVSREAKQQIKRARDKSGNSKPQQRDDSTPNNEDDEPELRRIGKGKGTYASFLAKIENFLDRFVAENVNKGPTEHKEKVRKVLDIWTKTSTFSAEALKGPYARLSGQPAPDAAKLTSQVVATPSANEVKGKDVQANPFTQSSTSNTGSTTPPYPPPVHPIQFPPLPPLPRVSSVSALSASNSNANVAGASSVGVPSASLDSLASLLAFQQPPQATMPNPAPSQTSFDVSQLALLQQLATQTGNEGSSPSFNTGPPSFPPSSHYPQQDQSYPHASTSSHPYPPGPPGHGYQEQRRDGYGGRYEDYTERRRPSPPRGEPMRRRWDDRDASRRSASPPRRDRNAYHNGPNDHQDERRRFDDRDRKPYEDHRRPYEQNYSGSQGNPMPNTIREPPAPTSGPPPRDTYDPPKSEETSVKTRKSRWDNGPDIKEQAAPELQPLQSIASFMSDEQDNAQRDRPVRNDRPLFGENRSSMQNGNLKLVNQQKRPPSNAGLNDSFSGPADMSGVQEATNISSVDLIQNAQPFNPMTFNALQPESWASFAVHCQQMLGQMPSNTDMVAWIMNSMAMMQQSSAMGMPNSMNGMNGMAGMMGQDFTQQQDMKAQSRSDDGMKAATSKSARSADDDSSNQMKHAPPSAEAHGIAATAEADDGEAEMDLTNDD